MRKALSEDAEEDVGHRCEEQRRQRATLADARGDREARKGAARQRDAALLGVVESPDKVPRGLRDPISSSLCCRKAVESDGKAAVKSKRTTAPRGVRIDTRMASSSISITFCRMLLPGRNPL